MACAGGRRRPQEVRIGPPLRHVFGAGEAEHRRLVLVDVVGDGEQFESGERSEDGVDLVALDQFLRFGLGAGGIAAGIGGDEVDLAAGEGVVLLLQVRDDALFHLDAALRQRSGLDGEQAELERRGLRDGRRGKLERRQRGAGSGAGHKFTAGNFARHCIPPSIAPSGAAHFLSGFVRASLTSLHGRIQQSNHEASFRAAVARMADRTNAIIGQCIPVCKARLAALRRGIQYRL